MEFLYSSLQTQDTQYANNQLMNNIFLKLGLHELFTENNNCDDDNYWYLSSNHIDQICYTRKGYETDSFEINILRDKIYVSVPIKNSIFQFKTSFNDYTSAFNYIEQRFHDFSS